MLALRLSENHLHGLSLMPRVRLPCSAKKKADYNIASIQSRSRGTPKVVYARRPMARPNNVSMAPKAQGTVSNETRTASPVREFEGLSQNGYGVGDSPQTYKHTTRRARLVPGPLWRVSQARSRAARGSKPTLQGNARPGSCRPSGARA